MLAEELLKNNLPILIGIILIIHLFCFLHLFCRKVVRRASLSDRTNLYRKEYEKEAIVWQQIESSEEQRLSDYNGDIREACSNQENTDPVKVKAFS